jgi:hypothetical protein
VIEETPELLDARPRLLQDLERFWAAVRARSLPVHLVLSGSPSPAFDGMLGEEGTWVSWIGNLLSVNPLTYREVGALVPRYQPRERLLTWMIFGGLDRHLRHCDPDVSLATNVRQAILAIGAPLLTEGIAQLQRSLQSVSRYASLLRSMASGRREWGDILAGTPELDSGGQMAPYLARLQQLGVVAAEASLDARPGSRSRRYRIVDPFLCFWYRFVLPHLTDLFDGRASDVWRQRIRPGLDSYASALFPSVCREYLTHYAGETLLATAREVGGLWGADYEMDPAGTLRTGGALYGHAYWSRGRTPEAAVEALETEMRKTRYGFGREARLRLLFSTEGFTRGMLRRGARSEGLHLIDGQSLFGG